MRIASQLIYMREILPPMLKSLSMARICKEGRTKPVEDINTNQTYDPLSASMFLNSRIWGFALLRSWVYLMFLGVGASILTLSDASASHILYISSSLALIITLLLSATMPQALERTLMKRSWRTFAAFLTAAGTLCAAAAAGVEGLLAQALALCAGLTTGIGSGFITLCYGEVYSHKPPAEVGIEIPMAALIAGVTFTVVSLFPPAEGMLIASVLPLVSGFIMNIQPHVWSASLDSGANQAVFKLTKSRVIIRIGVCACGVGIADSLSRQTFIAVSGISAHNLFHPALLISSVVLAIVLISFMLLRRDQAIKDLYKLVTFLIAASIVFLPVFTENSTAREGALLAIAGYNTFNIFIWILLADISYNFKLPAVIVFGIGWGMLTIGATFGEIIGGTICDAIAMTPQNVSLIVGIAVLLVFGVCTFVFKDEDLLNLNEMAPLVDSAGSAIDKMLSEEEHASKETVQAPGRFYECCMQLARSKGLTPRETEILLLFAKGRTNTRIQEELYISKGTVATHLQHIYRKADVHSKQELLDLIESMRNT